MSGAGAVNFQVTAVDSTTKVFDGIQKRLDKMNKPLERLGKAFGGLSKSSGLTALIKGTKDLGDHAMNTARSMGQIVEPLGVITGAASIAGLIRLTTVWANWGSNLRITAQNIGVSAATLQTWQGSAQLAGSSASALSTGMQTLGQNMWNAIGGRAPQITAAMQILGISWKQGALQAKAVTQVMPQIADRIARLHDPYKQAAIATALFGSAGMDLLPFLRLGSKGIAQYNAAVQRYGVTNQAGVDAANKLRMSQAGLSLAVQGLGNSIAEKLQPFLGPMIDYMGNWIAAHRGLIATKISEWLRTFQGWIVSTINKVQNIVDLFGGWKRAAEVLAGFMGVSWLARMMAPIVTITAGLARVIGLQRLAVAGGAGAAAGEGALAGGALGVAALVPAAIVGAGVSYGANAIFGNNSYATHSVRGRFGPVIIPNTVPGDVNAYIARQAAAAGLNPRFMQALALKEGGGYDNTSSAGAVGPMQLMPGTASDMGVKNINDWHQNVDGGIKYFGQLLKQFGGNYDVAAAAYNAGPGNSGVQLYGQTGLTGGLPDQTKDYVSSIEGILAQQSSGPAVNIGGGHGIAMRNTSGASDGGAMKLDVHFKNAPEGMKTNLTGGNDKVKPGGVKISRAMLTPY